MKSFFIVWREGFTNPKVRHETEKEAEREAHRLAMATPGAEFFVLKARSRTKKVDVERELLEDDIPF